jgi:hypothetical protein
MDGSVQVRRRCGYVIAPRLFPREQRRGGDRVEKGAEVVVVDGAGRWNGAGGLGQKGEGE